MSKDVEIYHPSLLDLLFGVLGIAFLMYILFQNKPYSSTPPQSPAYIFIASEVLVKDNDSLVPLNFVGISTQANDSRSVDYVEDFYKNTQEINDSISINFSQNENNAFSKLLKKRSYSKDSLELIVQVNFLSTFFASGYQYIPADLRTYDSIYIKNTLFLPSEVSSFLSAYSTSDITEGMIKGQAPIKAIDTIFIKDSGREITFASEMK